MGRIEGTGGRGKKWGEVSFGKEDREEFGEVEIKLIAVVELHVPNEFGVSGHVVVGEDDGNGWDETPQSLCGGKFALSPRTSPLVK